MSEKLTPLLAQYRRIKREYADTLLLFRVGDFYEMFYEDAETGSRALGLTLTSRPHGRNNRVPLAGVPAKTLDTYVGRLVAQGFKVAICDQLESPSGKPVVARDVTEVVTPGTLTRPGLLDERRNNFLLALSPSGETAGLAFADVSTGEFHCGEVPIQSLAEELQKLEPSEVLIPKSWNPEPRLLPAGPFSLTRLDDYYFTQDFSFDKLTSVLGVANLDGFGIGELTEGICAAGAVLHYLEETKKSALPHIHRIAPYTSSDHLLVDRVSRRNLELVERLRPVPGKAGTLLSTIDRTRTAAGSRLLRRWLLAPLLDPESINARLDAVEELSRADSPVKTIQSLLAKVGDLERVGSRVALERANARELVALKNWLSVVPDLKSALASCRSARLSLFRDSIEDFSALREEIEKALSDDPPVSLTEGGLIREGYNDELDELRSLSRDTKQHIAKLQDEERRRTGIPNLRVGYNTVFGYYIEVTKSYLSQVPKNYLRKQTLTGAERFVTPELKDYEVKVTTAEERARTIEYDLFVELRRRVGQDVDRILALSSLLAEIDVLAGFAQAARENHYTRPVVDTSTVLEIKRGRHPVVETFLDKPFIPNDTFLDTQDEQILIITGPNMAGKSTYLRQVALIVIMAQTGSFVPAASARIGVCDKIFTRIGASDDVTQGVSTFLAEMNETANILNNATNRSLVILDEVGRGTATNDGLAIAWATVEYLHGALGSDSGTRSSEPEPLTRIPQLPTSPPRPRTLFATHYHELTDIAVMLPRCRNYNFSVKETKDTVLFLRKLMPGPASKSYGIAVARLAGLPVSVIERARQVLADFEKGEHLSLTRLVPSVQRPEHRATPEAPTKLRTADSRGLEEEASEFRRSAPEDDIALAADRPADHPAIVRLRELNLEQLTPLQALNLLAELKRLTE